MATTDRDTRVGACAGNVDALLTELTQGRMITVVYASTNDDKTNECYKEHFLPIKSERYNEKRYYNERGGILTADVTRACA
jgi:hypothetical protein